jgi:hypothetical protein
MAMPRQQPSAGVFGAIWLNVMVSVEMTQHLYRFFPQLVNLTITVPAGSVADILDAVNEIAQDLPITCSTNMGLCVDM